MMMNVSQRIAAFALSTLVAAQSYAACSIATPGDCLTNPGSIGSGELLGRYEVSVQNTCNKKIWVASHYKAIPDGSTSTLDCVGCENPTWPTAGYWSLNPGEKKFIVVTQNRIVYIHAHSDDGKTTWSGTDKQWYVGANKTDLRPFFEVTLPNSYSKWTQTLSCN